MIKAFKQADLLRWKQSKPLALWLLIICQHYSLYAQSSIFLCSIINLFMLNHQSIYAQSSNYLCSIINLFMLNHQSIYAQSSIYLCPIINLFMLNHQTIYAQSSIYLCSIINLFMPNHQSFYALTSLFTLCCIFILVMVYRWLQVLRPTRDVNSYEIRSTLTANITLYLHSNCFSIQHSSNSN